MGWNSFDPFILRQLRVTEKRQIFFDFFLISFFFLSLTYIFCFCVILFHRFVLLFSILIFQNFLILVVTLSGLQILHGLYINFILFFFFFFFLKKKKKKKKKKKS